MKTTPAGVDMYFRGDRGQTNGNVVPYAACGTLPAVVFAEVVMLEGIYNGKIKLVKLS